MPRGVTDQAEFQIQSLNAAGEGVAAEGGHTVFGALPGESVRAERNEAGWRVEAIDAPSPERATPFCPLFGRCGGCATQHFGPDLYASWKRQLVVDGLAKARLEAEVAPLFDAGGEGRRRAIFHARFGPDGAIEVGFMRRRSHEIVDIPACPVLCPALSGAPHVAHDVAKACAGAGKPLDIQVTAADSGLDVDIRGLGPPVDDIARALVKRAERLDLARLSVHRQTLIERREPTIVLDGVAVALPPGGFLQATTAGEAEIAARVVGALGGVKAVADLFCGGGAFALRLARRHDVLAVDGEAAAIKALAQASGRLTGRRAIAVETRDLFMRPLQGAELDRFGGVVFDPPRAGAERQARALAASAVSVVVAVSCNVETFARDAKILRDGGYRMGVVTPIDQFRYSQHVEIVATFTRSAKRRAKGVLS